MSNLIKVSKGNINSTSSFVCKKSKAVSTTNRHREQIAKRFRIITAHRPKFGCSPTVKNIFWKSRAILIRLGNVDRHWSGTLPAGNSTHDGNSAVSRSEKKGEQLIPTMKKIPNFSLGIYYSLMNLCSEINSNQRLWREVNCVSSKSNVTHRFTLSRSCFANKKVTQKKTICKNPQCTQDQSTLTD